MPAEQPDAWKLAAAIPPQHGFRRETQVVRDLARRQVLHSGTCGRDRSSLTRRFVGNCGRRDQQKAGRN